MDVFIGTSSMSAVWLGVVAVKFSVEKRSSLDKG